MLGNTVNCKSVDTRGDPADAVPAARQMFATTCNLALVIGVTSDEAASVVPIINANKMVVFGMTGQSEFDSTHFDYFYRLVAPDLAESYAMVAIAQQKGYKKVALAFGNDIGSQTFVKPADRRVGQGRHDAGRQRDPRPEGQHVPHRGQQDRRVAPRRDLHRGARGRRRPASSREVKQLNGGKMIPVVGTSACHRPGMVQVGVRRHRRPGPRRELHRRQHGDRHHRAGLPDLQGGAGVAEGARSAAPATSTPT